MALLKNRIDTTGSGSKGVGARGIYEHATDTKADIQAAGYFNAAASELANVKVILIVASDATFEAKVTIAGGVVTLAALDTF